jgi:hypothetical protein
MSTSTIQTPAEGFARTITALKLLLGAPATEQPIGVYTKFGYHGYSVVIYGSQLDYLADVNSAMLPAPAEFDNTAIERWHLMNDLVIGGLSHGFAEENRIARHYTALAALVAFPTLEELARQVCGHWDEDGRPTREIPISEGIVTREGDSRVKPEAFKGGRRVVQLSHKLQLMHKALDPGLAHILDGVDRVSRRSPIQGDPTQLAPLYDRLQHFRDRWVHGRKFEGFEALLVSHIIGLIYFGILGARGRSLGNADNHP